MGDRHPTTPDGRHFVVRGRLWRRTNPHLPDARRRVDAAKVALGERGPVWWADGSPDYNRKMAVNTPYREWFERLRAGSR